MSTYRLTILAGRRGALLTHPSDSVNPDTFDDDRLVQVGRCLFNIFFGKFE